MSGLELIRIFFVILDMSVSEKKTHYTFEEYLAQEDQAEFKSEFYQGEIFAMSGGTKNHSLIGLNINAELRNALRGSDCFAGSNDLKIRIEAASASVFPDGLVVCGKEEYHANRKDIITNPTVVIEVLSESTTAWNYSGKFRQYQMLPSLQEYVLVEQKEPQVDIFRRNEEGLWVLEGYKGLEAWVEFKSLSVKIAMREIYHRVEF
jgi:Uma2 family endonuclease